MASLISTAVRLSLSLIANALLGVAAKVEP